tara:strand:+ start:27560 stop:28657 length:1098 start_codon:yes stop_codon:yes gene_type:complete
MSKIIYVIDSTDYHAMDWFHMVKKICSASDVFVVTDRIYSNDEEKLEKKDDKIISLFNVNRLLFFKNSKFSDFVRNVVKILILPIQIFQLKKIKHKNPDGIFHAHSMYYIFLCWAAGVKAIGTPMGSDVLVRPDQSKIYKFFTVKSLKYADIITVDSISLVNKIFNLTTKKAYLIQNGVNTSEIFSFKKKKLKRKNISSIRGLYPNYQIEKIMNSRFNSDKKKSIDFIYPFYEKNYKSEILNQFCNDDRNLGRLSKENLFKNLCMTTLAISIPFSDSSPRTVYEAIFCGCVVAVTKLEWINSLTDCMKERIIVVDPDDVNWFKDSLEKSKAILKKEYIPSQDAIDKFDEEISMKNLCKNIYKVKF